MRILASLFDRQSLTPENFGSHQNGNGKNELVSGNPPWLSATKDGQRALSRAEMRGPECTQMFTDGCLRTCADHKPEKTEKMAISKLIRIAPDFIIFRPDERAVQQPAGPPIPSRVRERAFRAIPSSFCRPQDSRTAPPDPKRVAPHIAEGRS